MKYNNQNVLTINQVAELFEQNIDAIIQNIDRASEKYSEGIFFQTTHEEAKELINKLGLVKNSSPNKSILLPNDKKFPIPTYDGTKGIKLITEKGFALLAKQSNSDLAWDIYMLMVDSYFNIKQTRSFYKPTLPATQPTQQLENQIPSDTILTRSDIIRKITNNDSHKDTQSRRRYNINRFEHNLLKSQCILLTAEEFEKYVITEKGVHYGFSFIQDDWGFNELQAPLDTWLDILKDRL